MEVRQIQGLGRDLFDPGEPNWKRCEIQDLEELISSLERQLEKNRKRLAFLRLKEARQEEEVPSGP